MSIPWFTKLKARNERDLQKKKMSRSVSMRSETRMVDGKMKTMTVTEETITRPDGSVEKRTTTNTTDGGDGTAAAFDADAWFQKRPEGFPARNSIGEAPAANAMTPPSLEDFHESALKKHNEYRAKHGVSPLKLNPKLCAYAQEWADHIARTSNFQHRPGVKYGENIYYGMNSRGINPLDAVDNWYGEVKNYNYKNPCYGNKSGHFTQVVWAGSAELGIGRSEPRPGTVYVVANYDPPGNVVGHFPDNVHPPR